MPRLPQPVHRPRLLTEERRRKILSALDADGRVTIPWIVRTFGVSAVTARADLDNLAARGLVARSHGGAVPPFDPQQDYPLQFKESLHHAEKVRIATAALGLLTPGSTIILDSGSTTAEIAKLIRAGRQMPLTVITNALNIATELAQSPQVTLLVIGGVLRPTSSSFVGPQAEAMLRQLRADHLFLGVDGLDAEVGASTPDVLEAQLNGVMMSVARQVTVVADASKLGRRSLSVIGELSRIGRVITTEGADASTVASLSARGIEVLAV